MLWKQYWWSILVLLAFVTITHMAVQNILLNHQQQQQLQVENTRNSIENLVHNWEKSINQQMDSWILELANNNNPHNITNNWKKIYPWLDDVYIGNMDGIVYPENAIEPLQLLCTTEEENEKDCASIQMAWDNHQHLEDALLLWKENNYAQAQFVALSRSPNIRSSVFEYATEGQFLLEILYRRNIVYKTETVGSPQNGGQSLLGISVQELSQLPPVYSHFFLEDITPYTEQVSVETQKLLQRVQRRWWASLEVQNIAKQAIADKTTITNDNNLEIHFIEEQAPLLLIRKNLDIDSYVVFTVDVPTLMDNVLKQHIQSSNGSLLLITKADNSPVFPLNIRTYDTEHILFQIPGSVFFPQYRITWVERLENPSIQQQILTTLLPLILAGVLGLFGFIGIIRADQRRLEFIERQQAFIARVTHELKTPIAGIQLMAESLQMGVLQDSEQSAVCVEKILQETHRLESRINEVLQVAKRTEIKRIELIDSEIFILELYDLWLEKFQAQQGMLRLEYDSFEFYGDVELLKDAVSNLLSNALKYQHPQHKLRCVLSIKEYGKHMEISVMDNGMGVPPADRKRIFDRFVRIEGNHRGLAGGHGLGLAFVAETAEAHLGTVKCVDGIQTGSKFVLRIPLRHSLQTTWNQRIPWMKKQKK